jgi:hypothetical protein
LRPKFLGQCRSIRLPVLQHLDLNRATYSC